MDIKWSKLDSQNFWDHFEPVKKEAVYKKLIARLDESRHHFIGSRSPYHHDDLLYNQLPSKHSHSAVKVVLTRFIYI